jgi:transcription elongation factor GreA
MNTTNETKSNILAKVSNLKEQLKTISEQIDLERDQSNEDDLSIQQELLDKKDIIEIQINELLSSLKLIHESSADEYGKQFTIEINGIERSVTIVHPSEANPNDGKISIQSPLAQALIGKKQGDTVEVDTPAGTIVYKVIN